MLPTGALPESRTVGRRAAGSLVLVDLVLCFFFLTGVVKGAQTWKSLDADLVPPKFSQILHDSEHSRTQSPLTGQLPCAYLAAALRAADRRVEFDKRMDASISASELDSGTKDLNHRASDLQYDLKILEHDKAELDKCLTWNEKTAAGRGSSGDCPSYQFVDFHATQPGGPIHEVLIWRQPESYAVFFESGVSIDADGAPNAYHPDNIGLDDLSNAGAPGFWEGLAQDKNGDPYVQGPDDPFPGYYVSTTDLADRTEAPSDPSRYVDASKIPYLVLPSGIDKWVGAHPGDFALVFNLQNLKSSPAIFADTGPSNHIGEGSIALAENLELWSDARSGGTTRGILYLVFPGSGDGRPRPIEEIQAEAEKLFQAWGGDKQLVACGIR